MAGWNSLQFKFNLFDPLKPPLEAVLIALEIVEAILEALLELLKPFFLDLLNPLAAIIQALLAALNALINQIESTGLNLLLVHPDTSQPDIGAVFDSISGGYTTFENKVIQKIFDASDIFRPQYAPGSSVAMLIFYLGAESPGDIIGLIMSLLALIQTGIDVTLPAPVDFKVMPTDENGAVVSQFRSLWARVFGDSPQLTLEWRMPQAPQGTDIGGAINQAVSLYNTTRLPNFIVERTGPFPPKGDEKINTLLGTNNPLGEPALMEIESGTLGKKVKANTDRYNFPAVRNKVYVKDIDGSVFKIFPTKFDVRGGNLAEGLLTGSYEFIDDNDLVPGSTYYYRVRAYFGDATAYASVNKVTQGLLKTYSKQSDSNERVIDFPDLSLGKPSRVVSAIVPQAASSLSEGYNPYLDVLDAVRVGLLLNFELTRTYGDDPRDPIEDAGDIAENPWPEDTDFRLQQKTGWGTLAGLAGSVGPLKAIYPISTDLQDNILFNSKARRLVNMALSDIARKPQLASLIESKWSAGVGSVVGRFYKRDSGTLSNDPVETRADGGLSTPWVLPGIIGGVTGNTAFTIEEYLSREDSYTPGYPVYPGPVPLSPEIGTPYVTVEERQDLANFIRLATGGVGPVTSYLAWQALTVGDLFPTLTFFLFDFEQFLLALLNAVNSILQAIKDIIETLLQKIRALKQIVETILEIIKLLSIEISLSVFFTSGFGDASTLATELMASENKPGDSPFGLHSGIVMTAGGPGPGFVAALEVLLFIFSLGNAGD